MRINAHAQDDGFTPQEDPSNAASDTRSSASREKGSAAGTKEREGLRETRLGGTRSTSLGFPMT
jgi:hypothetical protein